MLGKGLESLIPQKGNNNAGAGTDGASSVTPAAQPQPVRELPQETPPMALPTEPVELELPAAPVLPELEPQSPPQSQVQPRQIPSVPTAAAVPAKTFDAPRTIAKPGKINTTEPQTAQSVFHIEVNRISPNPGQPRRHFDEAALQDLARSIREFGFLQPLVVSRVEKETPEGIAIEYQLIAGERRFMAAKMLGLPTVPAIVRNVNLEREKLELAVLENIQRENLNPVETARAFQRLQEEFRMTQREIAAKLGKSREVVANAVRLLDLPEAIQVAVEKSELSESNARLLLGIGDPGAQKRLFEDIVQNRLTTRDVKERVQQFVMVTGPASGGVGGVGSVGASGHRRGRPPKSAEAPLAPELKAMQESLSTDLGAPVEIHKGAGNGRITITFYSEEELENILRKLGKEGF